MPTSPYSTLSEADLELGFLDDSNEEFEDKETEFGSNDFHNGAYNAEVGMESMIYTIGNLRPMLFSEYQVAFRTFPGLANATQAGKWPNERKLECEEEKWIENALSTEKVTEKGKIS